jgi:hypothetical protein
MHRHAAEMNGAKLPGRSQKRFPNLRRNPFERPGSEVLPAASVRNRQTLCREKAWRCGNGGGLGEPSGHWGPRHTGNEVLPAGANALQGESVERRKWGARSGGHNVKAAAQVNPAPTAVQSTGPATGARAAQAAGRVAEPRLPRRAVSLRTCSLATPSLRASSAGILPLPPCAIMVVTAASGTPCSSSTARPCSAITPTARAVRALPSMRKRNEPRSRLSADACRCRRRR